jgi:hypothetical protein
MRSGYPIVRKPLVFEDLLYGVVFSSLARLDGVLHPTLHSKLFEVDVEVLDPGLVHCHRHTMERFVSALWAELLGHYGGGVVAE